MVTGPKQRRNKPNLYDNCLRDSCSNWSKAPIGVRHLPSDHFRALSVGVEYMGRRIIFLDVCILKGHLPGPWGESSGWLKIYISKKQRKDLQCKLSQAGTLRRTGVILGTWTKLLEVTLSLGQVFSPGMWMEASYAEQFCRDQRQQCWGERDGSSFTQKGKTPTLLTGSSTAVCV